LLFLAFPLIVGLILLVIERAMDDPSPGTISPPTAGGEQIAPFRGDLQSLLSFETTMSRLRGTAGSGEDAPGARALARSIWALYEADLESSADLHSTGTIELLPDSRYRHRGPESALNGSEAGKWDIDGNKLVMTTADGFVEYRGIFTALNVLTGRAQNRAGDTWLWTAVLEGYTPN
jgi:hypothetical protein